MSKSPTPTQEVATVTSGVPAEYGEDLAQYAGAGISDRTQDFALPFLAIAQANSPQLKRQQADKYIPGLEAGDVFNTATRQFWKGAEGVPVIPVWFQKAMVEWILRSDGGGYVATHDIDTPLMKTARIGGEGGRFMLLPNSHQMVDTSYHFVVDPENGDVGVVSMTSTGLGCSRMWQTMMKQIKVPVTLPDGGRGLAIAPSFARIYRLRTVWKKNDQGDWYTWSVSDDGWALPEHRLGYEAARHFFLQARERGVVLGRPPTDNGDEQNVGVGDGDTPI